MGNVNSKLLVPLAKQFGKMPNDDAEVLAMYERVLGRFSDEVLEKAAIEVAGTFLPSKMRPWPPAAVCRKACEKMAPSESVGGDSFYARQRQVDDEAQKFARRWLADTRQGQMASAEGWGHEAAGLVRQMYRIESRKHPVAPADIVLDDHTVITYRKAYGLNQYRQAEARQRPEAVA